MLNVNTNSASLNTFGSIRSNQLDISRSFERLSSGLRINGAKDDAAGLSISTRMTAQVLGNQQASRNANDSISYLQTTEGALVETNNILQRLRELAVQSGNETLNVQDREAIQGEMNQLFSEVDRINQTTNFNNRKVFSQHKTVSLEQTFANGGKLNGYTITYNETEDLTPLGLADANERREFALNGLKTGWLQESEAMIEEHFGLFGGGATVAVDFAPADSDGPLNVAAFVSASGPTPQRLFMDLHDFDDAQAPDGAPPAGAHPDSYADRTVAHEMVHVAMNASSTAQSQTSNSAWFNEGAAELIHGAADVRLGGQSDAQLATMVQNAFDAQGFNGSDIDYGGAYIAAAFLHNEIQTAGGTGIKDLFTALQSGTSFDGAVSNLTNFANRAAFDTAFQGGAGDTFAQNLRDQSAATGDTGAIGGLILDGGATQSATDVVANNALSTTDKKGGQQINFHIGSSTEDQFKMFVGSFNVDAMGLRDLDVIDHSNVDFTLSGLDDAINYVAKMRSELGAVQNRLDSTINSLQVNVENTSASRSRILDADFAVETLSLTKAQIIQQASTSVLSQANIQPQLALNLL
jgi:flagellin